MVDPEGFLEAVLCVTGAAYFLQTRVAHDRPQGRQVVTPG